MAGAKAQAYFREMVARAKELRASDAFAPARSASGVPTRQVRQEFAFSKRRIRQTVALGSAVCLVAVLMSLLLPYYGSGNTGLNGQIYSPVEVAQCWGLWFQVTVMPLFDPTLANQSGAMIASFSQTHEAIYSLVVQRGAVTLIVIAVGFMLAVSGMLFQTSFRNPLATPTMLGVSDGVSLGCIVFATLGYAQAADNLGLYFGLVYGFGALVVAVVLLLSRVISGGRVYNVFDMLLLGTIISQLLGGVNSYISNFLMSAEVWDNFYNLTQATDVLNQPATWALVAVIFLATGIPVYILRFKLNLVSFSDAEGRLMGVRTGALRVVALVLGSAMQLAAIASVGQVAMLSLAVPFAVRYLMPSEFRYQLLGNFLLGVSVLLVAVALQHFAYVGIVSMPIGTVVSVLIIPFFVWIVALQRRDWSEDK